jgi:hypothetical protein
MGLEGGRCRMEDGGWKKEEVRLLERQRQNKDRREPVPGQASARPHPMPSARTAITRRHYPT